ncbi:MAG: type II secretion system GspH family protein [Ruminococcus sp.]|uniref:type II secretion system protein n=1 Tax=Ruminococcus sp. TaxID=41978 RepID=UPI0025FBD2A1|nr:type II secretion system protein [Ruminococcus sp.]MCR5600333.1 type II secretion system GspH family protein [Ruminococcus sp.]
MRNKQERKSNFKGFTLIELVIVIAIMAILAALLVPSIYGYLELARNRADVTAAKVLCNAIQSECAMDSDKIESFTHNPWGKGKNTDGSEYEADDHGYIYVDKKQVRVSSYSIAKLLEHDGYITDAGDFQGEIKQYVYTGQNCRRLLCKSNRTWYRYQINIAYRDGEIYFTYNANSRSGETRNVSGMSIDTNLHDDFASKRFANMIGGEADPRVSLPVINY